jgi:hypothetical protein
LHCAPVLVAVAVSSVPLVSKTDNGTTAGGVIMTFIIVAGVFVGVIVSCQPRIIIT